MKFVRFDLSGGVAAYVTVVADRTRRHEVGHALCRAALADYTGVEGEGAVLAVTPGGKPYAVGLDTQFSLSHSGGLALCAVGDAPVGADIERARTVSSRLMGKAQTAGYDGKTDFLYWWTAREANCKRLGRGFTWASLPLPKRCAQGTLAHEGETYYYSVCW